METIKSIREVYDFKKDLADKYGSRFDGYEVITDKQTYFVGISNGQSCCENWGYLSTEDDLQQFVGADLIDVNVTDGLLGTKSLEELADVCEDTSAMFVTFVTSEGPFQFVAYNDHNGYYGHDAVVISKTLNHEEVL